MTYRDFFVWNTTKNYLLNLCTNFPSMAVKYLAILHNDWSIMWARYLSRYSDWLQVGRSGIESRWGRHFPPVQTGPGAHAVSYKMGTASFPGVKCGQGVLLTTHHLLMPRSWKSRAIPLPTLLNWSLKHLKVIEFITTLKIIIPATLPALPVNPEFEFKGSSPVFHYRLCLQGCMFNFQPFLIVHCVHVLFFCPIKI